MDAIERLRRSINIPVQKAIDVEDGFIVVLDYYEAGKLGVWENLLRIRADGSVVWKLCTPSSSDMFTDVAWLDGKLVAWTWECFMVTIDVASGRILQSVFTK
ncbi:MAG TPA: hypothetical protein VFB63_12320 [Bryobacteraceae bacterium]|nr:hypothetical protein [Bryobacteraceae bacterium]